MPRPVHSSQQHLHRLVSLLSRLSGTAPLPLRERSRARGSISWRPRPEKRRLKSRSARRASRRHSADRTRLASKIEQANSQAQTPLVRNSLRRLSLGRGHRPRSRPVFPGGWVTSRSDLDNLSSLGQRLLEPRTDLLLIRQQISRKRSSDLSARGNFVTMEIDALPDLELLGRVESIAPGTGAEFSIHPPQNATGNFTKIVQRVPVRISIPGFARDPASAGAGHVCCRLVDTRAAALRLGDPQRGRRLTDGRRRWSGFAAGRKADATAWIAVAAGALGAMLATLDISIVNSALPTIQGEIGVDRNRSPRSRSLPCCRDHHHPSERVAGKTAPPSHAAHRRAGFTAFSVKIGIATDLTTMIIGRTGQGFMGGALIPSP